MSNMELNNKAGEEIKDETTLILRCQNGDENAFGDIIDRYKDKVYNLVLSMIRNIEDAEDVTQEVFIQLWKSMKNFKGLSSFGTWVYRVTFNVTRKYIRDFKKHNNKEVSLDQPVPVGDEKMYLEIPDLSLSSPLELLEEKELQERLQRAFDKLPYEYKDAVMLRVLNHLSYKEISDVLECPLGSVKSKLHNGMILLGKYLKE